MKVNTWKNVDIECEVDVSLEDCINEMFDIANSEDGWRRKISAVDGATKILQKIPPEMFAEYFSKQPGSLAIIRERLDIWIRAL